MGLGTFCDRSVTPAREPGPGVPVAAQPVVWSQPTTKVPESVSEMSSIHQPSCGGDVLLLSQPRRQRTNTICPA